MAQQLFVMKVGFPDEKMTNVNENMLAPRLYNFYG